MAKSCPDCGADVEYRARQVEILEGTCPGCGHSAVVVAPPTGPASEGEMGAAAASAPAPPTAPCWECGAALAFTVHPDHSVDAVCTSCNAATHLAMAVPEGEGAAEEDEEETEDDEDEESLPPPRRPRMGAGGRFPPRGPRRFDRDARPPRRDTSFGDRPPARPCRQCGGALEFTKSEDGTVTGSCRSCGNTFTMRPREDRPSRGFDRRPGWGGRPRSGSSYSSDRPRRYPRPRSDEDDRPRRRRRED
ncbi:MAG TPA: hypothetical protein VGS23_01825 [Thermoplasmata archaeon]|nr:hypothetical protein [Thermoplasmata archaeon]